MSATTKFEKASGEYRKFIQGQSACRARHTRLFEPDPDHRPIVKVSPAEVLNAFLRKNPHYVQFRQDLSKLRGDEDSFLFIAELWNGQLSA